MGLSFQDLMEIVRTGGNLAVLVGAYIMWRQNNRLIKIETTLTLMLNNKISLEGQD